MTLLCKEIWPLSLVSLRGIKITHKGVWGGRNVAAGPAPSLFPVILSTVKHKTDTKDSPNCKLMYGGGNGIHDFTRMRPNLNQMFDAVRLSWTIKKNKNKKRLRWFLARVGTFRSPRTLGYLRLCCPSFALCPPYKYSSRIKGNPLASWPVTRLSLLVPAESVRARCRGRGYTRHLSDWTIFRKFETMTWQDTPGSTFERGPLFVCQKCVRVMEGEIMALRGFEERSQSMDSVILKEETIQFQFSNTRFHGGRRA